VGKTQVDTPDIPVLTEVYKTKPSKPTPVKEQFSSEVIASIAAELRSEITAELKEELNQKLKQELLHKITEQLNNEAISSLRNELMAALDTTHQSVQEIESKLHEAAVNAHAAEEVLIEKNEALLESSKSDLAATIEHLGQAHSERLDLALANKVSEMQETALSEASSQMVAKVAEMQNTALLEAKSQIATMATEVQEVTLSEMTSQIAAKVAEMQESAVSETKLKITDDLNSVEEDFKQYLTATMETTKEQFHNSLLESQQMQQNAMDAFQAEAKNKLSSDISQYQQSFETSVSAYSETAKSTLLNEIDEHQRSFETTVNSLVEDLHTQMRQELEVNIKSQMNEFIQDILEKKKHTTVEELNRFYQEHTQQSQDNFAHRTQVMTQELKEAVLEHSQKLLLEANEAMAVAHQSQIEQAKASVLAQMNEALTAIMEEKRAGFKDVIAGDVPELEKILSEKLNHLFSAELPVFEESLMIKVKGSISEALQSVKLVIPS
jgi:myosin heavy subunit